MVWLIALIACGNLIACGKQQVVVAHDAPGCTNYDPDDPPEETLRVDETDAGYVVKHDGVFMPSDSIYDPEVELDRKEIHLYEHWEVGEAAESCFAPTLTLEDPDPGKYTVFWYRDGEDVPFDNITIEAD